MQSSHKTCSRCKRLKPLEEFHKLHSSRDGLQYRWKTCHKRANQIYCQTEVGKEKQRLAVEKYRLAHPERERQSKIVSGHKYRASGKGKASNMHWKKLNKGLVNADCAKRRAAKLRAIPSWSDAESIKRVYVNCPKGFHVDHIYPLISDWVCGLHCEDNLQYLVAAENLSKKNYRLAS